jgi:long-chain acyl-CoA synthetase
MVGYYDNTEATAATIRGGWFHTGDIGQLDADGYLSVTDRKKELLVTAGGENVAPQPIEALLKRDAIVAEAVLIGDRQRFVAALLIPDFALLEQRRSGGVAGASREALVGRDDVRELFQPIVDRANSELASFEQVKSFALLPAEFTVEGGELTPTLKVKRRVVADRWKGVIEAIYAAPPPPEA